MSARTGNMISCVISGSFESQLVATGFPVKPIFKLDKARLELLNNIQQSYEVLVLKDRLRKAINELGL